MFTFTYEPNDDKKTVVLKKFDPLKINFNSKLCKIKFERNEKLQYHSFEKNVVVSKISVRTIIYPQDCLLQIQQTLY